MRIKTCIVDSFTTAQFKGNPAGVCLLEEDLPVATMQSIALELGLSETAFVKRLDGVHRFSIRFFSPKRKPLCVVMQRWLRQKHGSAVPPLLYLKEIYCYIDSNKSIC